MEISMEDIMEDTLKLTLVSGNELTLTAEYSEIMEHDISDADGHQIDLGVKPVTHGSLKAYINGNLVDSCFSPSSWALYNTCNEKALAAGCTKGIIGIKVALTEENANLYKAWIDNVIESGTSQEAREYHANEEAKIKESRKASALQYITRAEKYIASGQKLMTLKEYKAWAKNYNNVVNEGGEGYIPDLPTTESYEAAKMYIESL